VGGFAGEVFREGEAVSRVFRLGWTGLGWDGMMAGGRWSMPYLGIRLSFGSAPSNRNFFHETKKREVEHYTRNGRVPLNSNNQDLPTQIHGRHLTNFNEKNNSHTRTVLT